MKVQHSSRYMKGSAVYVDTLRPTEPTDKPTLVLLHGGAHTGACYLATVDGRPGWAHAFARAGYPVMVPDWRGIGRSGHVAHDRLTGEVVCAGLAELIKAAEQPVVLITHSMSGAFGWKLLEVVGQQIVRLVAIAPAPPGNIQPAPEIVAETADTIEIRGTTNYTLDKTSAFVGSPAFAKGKLVGTSTQFPTQFLDDYVASLVPIPPRLLQQRLNIGNTQLRVDNFTHYRDKPVLIVTGPNDVDHPRRFDQAVADWLVRNGAQTDYWYLSDIGIGGNGHMIMLENNSDQVAELIMSWISPAKAPPPVAGS